MSYFGPNGSPLHNEEDDVTNHEEVETDTLTAAPIAPETWRPTGPDADYVPTLADARRAFGHAGRSSELDRLIVELAAVDRQRAELIAGIRKLLPPGVLT